MSYHQLVWSPNSIRGPEGPFCWVVAFPTKSCLQLVCSSTPDFLSSPSYIIVQSPTQSLEWYVWSWSSGNNCHAVHRSLSSGASVYECIMGFLPCPIFSAKPPTRFLLITAIGMCHFLPVHHFGMACLASTSLQFSLPRHWQNVSRAHAHTHTHTHTHIYIYTLGWVKIFSIFCSREEQFGNFGCLCRGHESEEPHWTVKCLAHLILSECYSSDLPQWLRTRLPNLLFKPTWSYLPV